MHRIKDEPTVDELNQNTKYLFAEMAFDAILKNNSNKARSHLVALSNQQLAEVEKACKKLAKIARDFLK